MTLVSAKTAEGTYASDFVMAPAPTSIDIIGTLVQVRRRRDLGSITVLEILPDIPRDVAASAAEIKPVNPLAEEFNLSASKSWNSGSLASSFSSPPLLDRLRNSVHQVLGPASPTLT